METPETMRFLAINERTGDQHLITHVVDENEYENYGYKNYIEYVADRYLEDLQMRYTNTYFTVYLMLVD